MSVSTLIQKMITRAKAQKLEQAVSYWERYKQILKEASAGEQPDPSELDAILAELGKKYEDMAPDAELLVSRERWASDAETIPSHQAAMVASQSKLDALLAEQNKAMAEYAAKGKALYDEVRHHEQQLTTAMAHRDKLTSTCADPSIKAREAELHKLGVELVPQERELRESINTLNIRIQHAQSAADVCQKHIDGYKNSPGFLAKEREELKSHKQAIQGYTQQLAIEQSKLDEINRQMQAIRTEREQLEKLKLIP